MLIGLVKWYDIIKGYGVILNPFHGEFFIHKSNFFKEPKSIQKGTVIVFSKINDYQNNNNITGNCRLLGELSDWEVIMNYLEHSATLKIETEFKFRGKWGKIYHRTEVENFNICDLSAQQLFATKNEDEIIRMVIEYFDYKMDKTMFISYCKFVETNLVKFFSVAKSAVFLDTIYIHFRNNLDEVMLFQAWKSIGFKYIGYYEYYDYQISEEILKKYSKEIGVVELKRILNYEYGSSFCNEIAVSKFYGLDELASDEIKNLYHYLDYVNEAGRSNYKSVLDMLLTEKIHHELIEQTDKLQLIKNLDDLNQYLQIRLIPENDYYDIVKVNIELALNQIIVTKSVDEFKPELWILGITDKPNFELISKIFHDNKTSNEKRNKILSKLDLEDRIVLIDAFMQSNEWERTFLLLETFLESEKSIEINTNFLNIINKILNKFSFNINNSIERFKAIIPLKLFTEELRIQISGKLQFEKKGINPNKMMEIFSQLEQYQIIKDSNQLLELIEDKDLDFWNLISLVSLVSNNCNMQLFRKIILKNLSLLNSFDKIEFLESTYQNQALSKVIIDEYISNETDYSAREIYSLVGSLIKSNEEVLVKYFLDTFKRKIPPMCFFVIFDLAIDLDHIEAQKYVYQNLVFDSEGALSYFIEKIKCYKIPNEVKLSNTPLTSFIEFINTNTNPSFTEDTKLFFQINKGSVQSFSIKFLIFQYHINLIDKNRLIEIVNSYQWTDISALLVKSFIEASNYTEKIILYKFKEIFKAHFEILVSRDFNQKSFLDYFTIKNVLKLCNGRKHYNGELWNGNGITRWYVSGEVSIRLKEKLNCYCEGRPWRKEIFWDSNSNLPLPVRHEKYWCKTNYCAARNDTIDLSQSFDNWTLNEIAEILNISIEKIALSTLSGWANRMNEIVEHLFCRSCNDVLRPVPFRPVTLGYYAVPLFQCINENCSDKQIIRFTHCRNGRCESHKTSLPLDSRDCESCKPDDPDHTGLKCIYCGSSCPKCSGSSQRIIAEEMW